MAQPGTAQTLSFSLKKKVSEKKMVALDCYEPFLGRNVHERKVRL